MHIEKTQVLQISRVKVSKRTVVPPNTVGYVKVCLEDPMNCSFIFEPSPLDKVLLSHVYGNSQTSSMTVEVINDSNSYVTFKKGKSVGHAEPADTLPDISPRFNVFKTDIEHSGSADFTRAGVDLPEHLKDMYRDNISDLSEKQKTQFRQLLLEFPDISFKR